MRTLRAFKQVSGVFQRFIDCCDSVCQIRSHDFFALYKFVGPMYVMYVCDEAQIGLVPDSPNIAVVVD